MKKLIITIIILGILLIGIVIAGVVIINKPCKTINGVKMCDVLIVERNNRPMISFNFSENSLEVQKEIMISLQVTIGLFDSENGVIYLPYDADTFYGMMDLMENNLETYDEIISPPVYDPSNIGKQCDFDEKGDCILKVVF